MDTTSWPMPPIPEERHLANNNEQLAEFILQHSPEEIAHLVIDLHAVSEDFNSELHLDILRFVGDKIAPLHPDFAASLVEAYVRDAGPGSISFISSVYREILGRGLPSIEQIVWDRLLHEPDDEAFVANFEMIRDMLAPTDDPSAWPHAPGADMYTESEQIAHMLTFARVKPRYERLTNEVKQRRQAAQSTPPAARG